MRTKPGDDYEIIFDGEEYTAKGYSEERAVENFAEEYYYGGDCDCPDGVVKVRKVGDVEWSKFTVTAEPTIDFCAHEVDG